MNELECVEDCGGVVTYGRTLPLMRRVPFFSGPAVLDTKIISLTLKDYIGKYVVLIFYPYDFTIVCPTELIQFSDRIEEFYDLGNSIFCSLNITLNRLIIKFWF